MRVLCRKNVLCKEPVFREDEGKHAENFLDDLPAGGYPDDFRRTIRQPMLGIISYVE